MNIMRNRNFIAAVCVVAFLSGCKASQPPSDTVTVSPVAATSAPATGQHDVSPAPAPAEASVPETSPTPIPDTADSIWQAIDQRSAELRVTIETGSLDDVHHQAFAIRDLVAALPGHSPTLPADEQSKLQNEVAFVATLASRLDEAGDAGDRAGAQANYDKLATVLSGITRTKP